LGVVANLYDPSTQEAEAEGLRVHGHLWVHSETLPQNKQTNKKYPQNLYLQTKQALYTNAHSSFIYDS
jgi:hypothetical protein